MLNTVRQAAVAGMFYPGHRSELAGEVDRLLREAEIRSDRCPKAIVVPHAGYVYSGPVAASAYVTLRPWRAQLRRVVLLGPSHREPLHGLALPSSDSFVTPLGDIPIDTALRDTLRAFPQISVDDRPHHLEHSLEVQLPFLQTVLDDFQLLPIAVGACASDSVAEVIDALWGGPETLIVVSSDLSHYLPYGTAQHLDRNTCDAILQLRADIPSDHACGAFPLNGLMLAARRHGLQSALLDLRNSGDTAGDKARVVGYAALAFYENAGHA